MTGRLIALATLGLLCACLSPMGMAGSDKRACYDAGVPVRSPEMKACVKQRVAAAQAEFDATNPGEEAASISGDVILAATGNAPRNWPAEGGAPLIRQSLSNGHRVCTYRMRKGDYVVTLPEGSLCPARMR